MIPSSARGASGGSIGDGRAVALELHGDYTAFLHWKGEVSIDKGASWRLAVEVCAAHLGDSPFEL